MRYILITNSDCLASLTATRWASKVAKPIEVVESKGVSSVSELYGVVKFPTLLCIGDYGVIIGRVEGYNQAKYDALVSDDLNGLKA